MTGACGSAKCPPGTVPDGNYCRATNATDMTEAAGADAEAGDGSAATSGEEASSSDGGDSGAGGRRNVAGSSGSGAPDSSGAPAAGKPADGEGTAGGGSTAGAGSDGPGHPGGRDAQAGQDAQPRAGQSGEDGSGNAGAGPSAPVIVCGDGKVEGGELCDGNCPALSACKVSGMCIVPVLMGDAEHCNARCDSMPITACNPGDGCCPSGCKYPADSDCSKSCGDGVVDAPEVCEPSSTTRPCPRSCDDGMACTKDVLTGSAEQCSAQCTNTPITAPAHGDGCCPPGANSLNDDDCKPACGNKVKEAGEACDGNCPTSCPRPGTDPCVIAELQGSGCNAKCVTRELVASRASRDQCCPDGANANTDLDCVATCGNTVKEADEICDPDCTPSCSSTDPCIISEPAGSPCKRTCKTRMRAASLDAADRCCPPGADHNTDADCEPPPWTYNRKCNGQDAWAKCEVGSGVDAVCHALNYCAPLCTPDLPCPPNPGKGNQPTCDTLCQIRCTGNETCPVGMVCKIVEGADIAVCGYNDP